MEKKQIRAVLFDLDGTLIDTEPLAAKAVQECFSQWRLEIQKTDSTYVTGRTWESAFQYLFSRYALPIPQEEAKAAIQRRYREILEEQLPVVPGGTQAVELLAARYSLGLVSGSTRMDIFWALDKLKIRTKFQVVLGAEDYPRSKPHPDGYLKAIQSLNVAPQSCLVFEDSTAGIQAARSAGLWVVAVTSTNHFRQDQTLAHSRIHDLREVTQNWISQLSFD